MHTLFSRVVIPIAGLCLATPAIAQNVPDNSGPNWSSQGIPLPKEFNASPNVAPALFNYQRTWAPRYALTDTAQMTGVSATYTQVATNYTNGWGGTLQSIRHNNTLGNDLIKLADGRQLLDQPDYLPYAAPLGSKFQQAPYGNQKNYYSFNFTAEGDNAYSRAKIAINSTSFLSSSQFGAGAGLTGESHGTSAYSIGNVYSETTGTFRVLLWSLDANGNPVSVNYYNSDELIGTKTEGQEMALTIEWKNKQGQVVYKQVSESGLGGSRVFLETYYVYNDLGQLVHVLTPKLIAALKAANPHLPGTQPPILAPSAAQLSGLCYSYKYDAWGQIIERNIPDRGIESTVYNARRQPVFMQTPLLAQQGKWAFTIFDDQNRVRFNGLYSTSQSRAALQGVMNTGSLSVGLGTNEVEYWANRACLGCAYPAALNNATINGYNYYDNYDFEYGSPLSGRSFDNSNSSIYKAGTAITPVASYNHVPGLPTGKKVRVVNPGSGTNQWEYQLYFYDSKGRISQVQTLNPWNSSSWDVSTNQYDFSGNKILAIDQFYGPSGSNKSSTKIISTYNYSLVTGQLQNVKMRTDGETGDHLLAEYSYDDMGRVKAKVLGGGAEVQNLTYNIRGQVVGLNQAHANGGAYPEQHFGYKLAYEYGFTNKRYDGAISGFQWRGSGNMSAYGYAYDDAGKMTQADFQEFSDPYSGPLGTNQYWNNEKIDYSVSQMQYDPNGNILSMKQRGVGSLYGTIQPVDMDRLQYNYGANSNRLSSVKDSVLIDFQLHDFVDRNTTATDYGYDADGNLAVDLNKGITDISYNELDLPVSVTTAMNGTISNVYDAGGTLVEKTITFPAGSAPSTNPWVYRYLGPFVYRNDSLLYVLHEEGRARWLADSTKFKYDFFLKDHLGNVRMTVVSDISAQGTDYLATHELASAGLENLVFTNIDKVRDSREWAGGPNNTKCARLNGGVDSLRTGTAILLNVMAGDNFELAAHAYYNSADDNNDPQYTDNAAMVESLIAALSGGGPGGPGGPGDGPGGPGGGGGNFGALQTMLNGANYDQFDLLRQNATDNTLPQSYINYMMFNEQMELLPAQSGAIQVKSASADAWSVTGTDGSININNNGYLLVFLGNNQDRDVYWDDLHVLHKKGRLLEENHYYPHGLTIRSGISSPLPTRQGYQGKELQDEVGMELYDFHARQYDPQVGRFWGVDPMDQFPSGYTGMGNDPANMIDPTGMASHGAGGGLSYDPFAVTPVFQGATFDGLRNPFDNHNFYDDVLLRTKSGGGGSPNRRESLNSDTDVPATGREKLEVAPVIAAEYEWNNRGGKWDRISSKGDEMGVDFYHMDGWNPDGTPNQVTYVTDRRGNWNTINGGRELLRGESRGEGVDWGTIFNEWHWGTGPEISLFEGLHPSNNRIKMIPNYFWAQREFDLSNRKKGSADISWNLVDAFTTSNGQAQMMGSFRANFYRLGNRILTIATDTKTRVSFYLHLPLHNPPRTPQQPGNFLQNMETNTYQRYMFLDMTK